MGNHGSRRKHRKGDLDQFDEEISEDTLNHIDDLEGTTPDSYNKLLAWLFEMAEHDDVNPEPTTCIEHITTVCADKRDRLSRADMPLRMHSYDDTIRQQYGPIRQHSYDSNSSQYWRSPRSGEDLLDPRTRFRRTMLSRQTTVDYSDDGDGAPMDISSGSSFDQDSEMDIVNPESVLLGSNFGETSFTTKPSNSRKPQIQQNDVNTYQGLSNSVGNLTGRGGINSAMSKKSKSLMTMKRMLSETRNDDEITPITEETVVKILDDSLLDRNMADILYSVEALWPKVPK